MKIFKITLIERDERDRRKIIDENEPANLKEVLDIISGIEDPEFYLSLSEGHLLIDSITPAYSDESDWHHFKINTPFYIETIIHGPKRALKRLEKVWRASNE